MPRPRAPWWMYLVAVSLTVVWGLNVWNEFAAPEPAGLRSGSVLDLYSTPLRVISVVPGYPLEKAGVRSGDVITAVDGQAVRSVADWIAVRANFEIGKPVQLDLRRGERALRVQFSLQPSSFHSYHWGVFVSTASVRLAQLIMLALALFILFHKPHDLGARLAVWLLCAMAVGNAAPNYGIAAQLRHLPAPLGMLWLLGEGLFLSSSIAWFCFFANFPRRLLTRPWHWLTAVLTGLIYFVPHTVWVTSILYLPDKVCGLLPIWLFEAGAIAGFGQDLAGLGMLVSNYFRLTDPNARRRVRVLFIGASLGLPAAALAVLSSNPLWAASGSVVFLVFPLSFAYAILRHQLFDVGLIIRQGLQYALARAVVVWMLPGAVALFLLDVAIHQGDIGWLAMGEFFAKSPRGWVYAVIGGLGLIAQRNRQAWLASIDRRFFRERYDAQRLLREVVEEVRQAGSFERVAPRVAARVEAALHPEFVALLVRESREVSYRSLASAPSGQAPPPLPAESKLMALVRVLGKPLEVSLSESGWLKQQLPHQETDFLRQARIDLLVPISVVPDRTEALLALGVKRSEEPYTREDQDLLVAIAASLALLLEKPAAAPARVSEAFEECPQCGMCYDTGAGRCAQEGANLIPVRLPRLLAGRYRLERRRGRGGMGTVYEATDTALERRVAVKVIRDDLLGSAEAAERFRREARAAASFTHPNVVTIHDFGVAEDTRAFLVMELLEGATLREELRERKRLGAPRVVEILRGVSAAVEAAHRRQLLHRDLKPENIFLTRAESGEIPKVLDFGVAKFLPAATLATADTGTGLLVGTLYYMAPEQLQGRPVQAAWDLWALAVVAYEMLTGAHPFAGATTGECHAAVLAGRWAPVAAHLPDSPARWQEFFAGALSLEPPRRPNSATAFFSQLEQALL